MRHLKLTFEDIMQASVLYYDETVEPACFDICHHLRIDNLPEISGDFFYELSNLKFHKRPITSHHKLSVNQSIFQNDIFDLFLKNKHNVVFIFEEEVIRGVVHISDYNRDIVLQSIQDDILSFERKLRQLILLNGYNNENMRSFFEYRKSGTLNAKKNQFYINKISSFDERKEEIDALGSFQLFEFSDLLEFSCSSFSNKTHKVNEYTINGKKINGSIVLRELRNMAMHGKNPVSQNKETSIYSIESLNALIESLAALRQEYGMVLNKIRRHPDFLKSIELENRAKLNIIHNHHPKALEYFLGI